MLTTDSGLVFTGDNVANLIALDSAPERRYGMRAGSGIESSPTSYELDGRQYVLVGAGPSLFAWALPEK